jgi:hypothetical protein
MLEVARVVQQGEKAKENPLIMTKGRAHSDTSLVSPQHQNWPNCTSLNLMGMTTQWVGFVARVEQFFCFQNIPEEEQVHLAAHHLEGEAQL